MKHVLNPIKQHSPAITNARATKNSVLKSFGLFLPFILSNPLDFNILYLYIIENTADKKTIEYIKLCILIFTNANVITATTRIKLTNNVFNLFSFIFISKIFISVYF